VTVFGEIGDTVEFLELWETRSAFDGEFSIVPNKNEIESTNVFGNVEESSIIEWPDNKSALEGTYYLSLENKSKSDEDDYLRLVP